MNKNIVLTVGVLLVAIPLTATQNTKPEGKRSSSLALAGAAISGASLAAKPTFRQQTKETLLGLAKALNTTVDEVTTIEACLAKHDSKTNAKRLTDLEAETAALKTRATILEHKHCVLQDTDKTELLRSQEFRNAVTAIQQLTAQQIIADASFKAAVTSQLLADLDDQKGHVHSKLQALAQAEAQAHYKSKATERTQYVKSELEKLKAAQTPAAATAATAVEAEAATPEHKEH